METIDITLMRHIDELMKTQNRKAEKIYLGQNQWIMLLNWAKENFLYNYIHNGTPEFMGCKVYQVVDDDHFNVT